VIVLAAGGASTQPSIRNIDLREEYEALAARTTFEWIARAVEQADEIANLLRRNIQKSIALDAFAVALR
jgi:DNA polymerase III subunit delta'